MTSRPVDTKQYNATVTDDRVTTEVFKRGDVAVEASFLESDVATVDERQTSVILKVDSADECIRWYMGRAASMKWYPGGVKRLRTADDDFSCHVSVMKSMSNCSSIILRHSVGALLPSD